MDVSIKIPINRANNKIYEANRSMVLYCYDVWYSIKLVVILQGGGDDKRYRQMEDQIRSLKSAKEEMENRHRSVVRYEYESRISLYQYELFQTMRKRK
jgi:hypothetical protein